MNSEEGLSLAKMAVSVLLVVLVIGAVVAIVYAAYSWFTSGTSKLGDQVNSINSSAYSQYDDTIISGSDVLSALKQYRDSEMAILISNKNAYGAFYTQGSNVDAGKKFYNYCALASQTAAGTHAGTFVATITVDNNTSKVSLADLKYTNNSVSPAMNTNFSPTTNKNASEAYVKQSANWYSKLIYSDATGDVCGILFLQMD